MIGLLLFFLFPAGEEKIIVKYKNFEKYSLDALKIGGNNFIGADPTLRIRSGQDFQRNIPERQKLIDRSIKDLKMIR